MLVTGWGCAESYRFKPDPKRAAVRYSLALFAGLTLCAASLAQAPTGSSSPVKVELSLAGDKTAYKIGEPILLRLTFSAATDISLNGTTTDPASPIDTLVVSPMQGVFPWLADQDDGRAYAPDYAAMFTIGPGKSQTIELPLNAVYRFDAGHYSVYVVTNRIQGSPFTTNSVTFDMQPMTEAEEAARAAELEGKIRNARTQRIGQAFASELDWLTGDASTRVKLSLFLHPKEFYPFAVDVTRGLWIARNRRLVVERLEKALQDSAQDLSPAAGLLATAVALRARLNRPSGGQASSAQQRTEEVESGYLKQIAASLPQRRGDALVTAAQTVFTRLAQRKEASGADFAAAREVLITHFAEINEYNVDWMLNAYGDYLLDVRLAPALKQILATQKDPTFGSERTAAIKQLVKLAPRDSRGEVVKEVCAANPNLPEIFNEIPFAMLPETDAAWKTSWRWRSTPGTLSRSNGPPR
jgi:hypothetical protein